MTRPTLWNLGGVYALVLVRGSRGGIIGGPYRTRALAEQALAAYWAERRGL